MKPTQDRQPGHRIWRTTTLSAAVLIGLTAIAHSATNGKRIGDLEIYEAAEGGKITITMMLDTSGSMSANVTTEACDLPSDISSPNVATENSSTTPSYTRRYCEARKYFYRYASNQNKWYQCGTSDGSLEKKVSACSTAISPPTGSGFSSVDDDNNRYFYKNSKTYDRLTRLKDALFTLMDNSQLDPQRVAIGIGQFSSQSNSSNTYTGADGSSGKIVVPAALVTPAQRLAIKTAVANLRGENGTPTANAYAEVGAYMLGTNTSTSITYPREEYRYVGQDVLGRNYYAQCTDWTGAGCIRTTSTSQIISTSGFTSVSCQYYINSTCLTKSKTQSAADWGFSGYNKSVTTAKSNNNYSSLLTSSISTASCDGRGIYFLTDGVPNSSPTPLPLMQAALGSKGSLFTPSSIGTLPNGTLDGNGMPEVGAFAKALRSSTLSPLGENSSILTAVVGFGSVFNVDRDADAQLPEASQIIRNLSYINSEGEEESSDFYNCNNIVGTDAKNACNWGAKSHPDLPDDVGKFGEGGFYSAQSTDDIVKSITSFVEALDQTLPSAPSGTITVPEDPYQAANQLAYAYLPVLAPDVSSTNSIWKGNLKKYNLNQGTLFGNNSSRLYENVAGDLSTTTQDIWQTSDFRNTKGEVANNDVNAGGVYAQLRTPRSGRGSVRKIYVEDYTSADNKKPILRQLSVNSAGTPVGFNLLVDTATYTQQNQRRLLSFLGFEKAIKTDGQELDLVLSSDLALGDIITSELTLVQPTRDIKVLGGVVHSTPTAVSYGATLDDNGRITSAREDYALFGSMDGALHLVDSDDGQETIAVIPRSMMINQPSALVSNSTKTEIGQPFFGVDAPWLVTTDYKYDLEAKKVRVDDTGDKGVFAYGGLRMGGEALYGMDITDESDPKVKFTITPDGLNYTASNDFKRLGQIWRKPTAAKVRLKASDTEPTDVLIFGGGYDMGYESETYVPTVLTPAKGNAIYMIKAKTGELVWSTSGQTGIGLSATLNAIKSEMIHSIVGEITVLDRDNDGLTDHIYAADLGGQVFRVDLQNARTAQYGFSAVASFSAKPAVRVLNTKPSIDSSFAYRFYERPIISFYRREDGPDNGKLFGLINVVSGNRSAPLSKLRDNNAYANRVYGIIDSDLTRSDLYTTSTYDVQNITEANLVNLATTLGNTPTETAKINAKAAMIAGTQNGWYYPLTRFDGNNNVKYNKGLGDSAVINSLLFTTVYNPDKQYGNPNSCTAKIRGGSERQLYCLPYGVCMDSTSVTGTGGFIPAGQGIQELVLGAFNEDNTNFKVLIGTTTIGERIEASNRVNFNGGGGGGGDGSAPEYIFNERYTVQPRVWYERTQ
nr:PilC/PilY family type IV pilus protein [uncultured Psychrobacter sp.]